MKKRNRITIKNLKKIIDIIEVKNIKETESYNYMRIIKENINLDRAKVLYFPIYLNKNDDQGGWYISDRDLRVYINNIIEKNPNATFVVEKQMLKQITNLKAKLIIVNNIMESIDKLSDYYIKKVHPTTILVTGSVGKTSTVGLIEKVLKPKVLIFSFRSRFILSASCKIFQ